MKEILETLQEEFYTTLSETESSTPRDYKFPEASKLIKIAIGMRRSGKTYFLLQTIRELVSKGIPLKRILYLNFEDDRILPMNYKLMGQFIDAWFSLHPDNHDHPCYLFLDEVQNVDGWPVVLRRMLDTKKVEIFATGSSAKLLGKEIATSLRGRSLPIEIFPYNYLEFLKAHAKNPPAAPFGRKMLDHQRKNLLDFFQIGGFPGIQNVPAKEQIETLQSYVDAVVFRDIVERYQITNIPLMKYLINSLLKNVSAPFSIHKFYNDIKSQGYKVAKDTIYSYLTYLEDAFLIFTVPIFTESLRKRDTAAKKIYAIDNGLIISNTFNLSENYGKLLENQIYLDLRREGKKIFYYITSDGYEIDFITRDLSGKHEILQVVWETDNSLTLEREKRALEQAKQELGLPGKLIDSESYLRQLIP